MKEISLYQRNSGNGTPSRNFLFKTKRRSSADGDKKEVRESRFLMRKSDFILIFILLSASVFLGIFFWFSKSEGAFVSVSVGGEPFGIYPLNRNAVVEIRTEDRENILVIEDGQAFVRSANCPNRICCAHQPIAREGEVIFCSPHEVVIAVCAE